MGTGQVAPVARWLATLKASGKLVPLERLGKCKRRLNRKNSAARLYLPVNILAGQSSSGSGQWPDALPSECFYHGLRSRKN